MALKSKINEDFEDVPVAEQISFDDIICEGEFAGEDELNKPKTYYTISGKEQEYHPDWERYTINDLNIGQEAEGRPEITIYEKPEKTYDAMKLRILDEGEIVDLYFNYPKKDWPYVKKINKYFDFYRGCFDFIFGVRKLHGDEYVVDENGEEHDNFNITDLEMLAKFVDQHERINVKIVEGNNGYDRWIITKLR